MTINNKRYPLLLFSGGLDSTYLLYWLLSESDVYTLYVNCGQGELKVSQELKARQKIIKELYKLNEINNRVLESYCVDNFKTINNIGNGDIAFKQVISWLIAAIHIVDPRIHSEVQIAYVIGDQITPLADTLKSIWENLWKVAHVGKEFVPLKFKLLEHFLTKPDILNRLLPSVVDKVWVCEKPVKVGRKIIPCNSCAPCKNLIGAVAINNIK